MPRKPSVPSYRFHKARNCAVVTINGRNHYLGPWQSAESKAKYDRLITEYLANGRALEQPKGDKIGPSLVELIALYLN